MSTLKDCKWGDVVRLISENGKYDVPIVRETLMFLECDLSSVPKNDLTDYGKTKRMMFSRFTGLKKGSVHSNDLDSPYIIKI